MTSLSVGIATVLADLITRSTSFLVISLELFDISIIPWLLSPLMCPPAIPVNIFVTSTPEAASAFSTTLSIESEVLFKSIIIPFRKPLDGVSPVPIILILSSSLLPIMAQIFVVPMSSPTINSFSFIAI